MDVVAMDMVAEAVVLAGKEALYRQSEIATMNNRGHNPANRRVMLGVCVDGITRRCGYVERAVAVVSLVGPTLRQACTVHYNVVNKPS